MSAAFTLQSSLSGFDIALPDHSPHDEYLRLALKVVGVGSLAALPMLVASEALVLVGEKALPAFLAIPATLTFAASTITFAVSVRLIVKSRSALDALYAEWTAWQSVNRECALTRASLEINVVGRGNKVTVNQPTQNNLNLGSPETPAETRIKFLRHVEEFFRRAQVTGAERSQWLAADGAPENYRFAGDGEALSRAEYEDILKVLIAAGKVIGRRKGRSGDTAEEPVGIPPAVPGSGYVPIQ